MYSQVTLGTKVKVLYETRQAGVHASGFLVLFLFSVSNFQNPRKEQPTPKGLGPRGLSKHPSIFISIFIDMNCICSLPFYCIHAK